MKKEIKTENLILKPANPAFAKARLDYYTSNRGYFTPYEPDMPDDFFELEASEAYLSYEKEMNEKGISHHFYAFLKDDPEKIVGTISFYHIRPMPYSSATVGYNVDHLLWGKGFGGEMCRILIPIVMEHYTLHRMEARVSVNNERSVRLLERLGFENEGIEKQSIFVLGDFTDHYRFALLKDPNK